MQKLNEKKILGTVPKKLQLVETFWDCPEFSRNKQKGITLIALIITIIVMLILVGVTVNVALNGGLFEKAETATKETEEKAILEEMLAMMDITDEGKINAQAIIDKMKEKYTVEGNIPNITITGKLGKYNYIVSETEIKIASKGNKPENKPEAFNWPSVGFTVDTDIEYTAGDGPVLIFTSGGKLIGMVNGYPIAEIDATNPDNIDEETGMLKTSFPVTVDGMDLIGTIVMNRTDVDVILTATVEGATQTVMSFTCAKLPVDKEKIYSNEEVLKALGETGGTYKGTWTKIGEENGYTKLVSTSNVAEYKLGKEDPKAIGADDLEKSIWSYKNAVTTLNTVAEEATGIKGARSITLEDISKLVNVNSPGEYEVTYNYANHQGQIFINNNGDTVIINSEKDEVTLKHNYMYTDLTEDEIAEHNYLVNSDDYLIATPVVHTYNDHADFRLYRMVTPGYIGDYYIFRSTGETFDTYNDAVRAIVYVKMDN